MASQTKSGSSGKSSGGSGSRSSGGKRSGGGSRSGNGSAPSRASGSRSSAGPRSEESGEPDVLLDVAQLKVEEIGMEVESLQTQVAVEARLGELLHLHVGAEVVAEGVALEIKGVDAQAQLKARLDKVLTIIERTLKTVDAHPEVLTELALPGSEDAVEALEHAGNGNGSNGESGS
jgi:hypothetical protein